MKVFCIAVFLASSGCSLSIRKSPRLRARYALVSKSLRVMNFRVMSGCMTRNIFLGSPEKEILLQARTNCCSFTIPVPLTSRAVSHAMSMFPCAFSNFAWSSDSPASVSGSRSRKRMPPCPLESRFFQRPFTSPWKPRRCIAKQNSPKVMRPLPSRSSASRQAPSKEPQRTIRAALKPSTVCRPTFIARTFSRAAVAWPLDSSCS
mmetsp:Transcript_99260/g.320130  ORF Transcript_99260/g.320130 Transcript_99260/m.320130 type:complete len:205 (-) Transcript_99260:514-1128(-)